MRPAGRRRRCGPEAGRARSGPARRGSEAGPRGGGRGRGRRGPAPARLDRAVRRPSPYFLEPPPPGSPSPTPARRQRLPGRAWGRPAVPEPLAASPANPNSGVAPSEGPRLQAVLPPAASRLALRGNGPWGAGLAGRHGAL